MPYADPARQRAYIAAYNILHRERIATRQSKYDAVHRDKIRVYQRTYRASYDLTHRAEKQARTAARRAALVGNGGSHTLQEWRDKCALLDNVCFYCGEAKPLTRDHKVPLARGGTDDIANVIPACGLCNSKKGTRTAAEYLAN